MGRVLSEDQLEELREALARFEHNTARHDPSYGILRHNVWAGVESIEALVRGPDLGRIAAALLGQARVLLFQDNLVWKPPGAARIEWHQDFSYWPLGSPRGVTQWIALDAADTDSGCLHYLPGTQLEGERQPADFIVGATQSARPELPPLDWERRAGEAVPAPVEPGELLVHHPLVWHMSPANTTGSQRRALSFTWIADSVTWAPDHASHPYIHEFNPETGTPVAGPRFPAFSVRSN